MAKGSIQRQKTIGVLLDGSNCAVDRDGAIGGRLDEIEQVYSRSPGVNGDI